MMKAIVSFLILTFSLSLYGFPGKPTSLFNEDTSQELDLRDSIVGYAQEHLGTPYKWGGATTEGFDCTGFVYFVFKKFGIHVSRSSSGFENFGEKIALDTSLPGDIMLFTGTDHTNRNVGHAGIVLQNEDGVIDFIHSSSSKKHFGVTITRYNASGYEKRFLRAIKVL
ncbi:MAG: C40 family peptidase [Crocinitomicaceae bacterium]|nr:C40 family peptidase [Crocinitomicaceae bacterium]